MDAGRSETTSKDSVRLWGARRLPFYGQRQQADCGLACLAMVAAYHGLVSDLDEISTHVAPGRDGISMHELTELADTLGLQARPYELTLAELAQLRTPFILHWSGGHWVVCARVSRSGLVLHDPAQGVRRMTWREAATAAGVHAIELHPRLNFEREAPQPRLKLRKLIDGMPRFWSSVTQLSLMALVLEALALLVPHYIQVVVDSAIATSDLDFLAIVSIGTGLLMAFHAGFGATRSWAAARFTQGVHRQVAGHVIDHLSRLPCGYFQRRMSGEIATRFESLAVVVQTFTRTFIDIGLDGVLGLGVLAMMAWYSPQLTALAVPALALVLLAKWLVFLEAGKVVAEKTFLTGRRQAHLLETLRAIATVKMAQAEDVRSRQWMALTSRLLDKDQAQERINIGSSLVVEVVGGAMHVAIVYLAARMILEQAMTTGMLFAYLAYQQMFFSRCGALLERWFWLRANRVHWGRVGDIVFAERETAATGHPVAATRPCAVQLVDGAFQHAPTQAPVFAGLSLQVPPGQVVAVVGPSGAGKTTLLCALAGLHPLSAGILSIDGQVVFRGRGSELRQRVAMVFQGDELFEGTIEENITWFERAPDRERVHHCASLAAIAGDIASMPMGYATRLGEGGRGLSGGQRQRIQIARALYRRPGLLILDEATSQVDQDTERAIFESLRSLGMTVILTTHRQGLWPLCDQVISLTAGRARRA